MSRSLIQGTRQKTCSRCGQGFTAYGREYCCPSCKRRAPRSVAGAPLTPREWHVVRLVHRCLSNKEIAANLCLSEGTVKEYLVRVFKKVRVKNRTELALWASSNLPFEVKYIA